MSDDLQVLLREAQARQSQRDWDGALEVYQKVMQVDPQNEESCEQLARVYAIRGMINQVINQYFTLMSILEEKGDLDLCLEVARWIIRIQPENDKARRAQIDIYGKKGDRAEVIAQSLKLARMYIELGLGDQSIELLKNAQEMEPANLDIGVELAEMYISHGHIQDGAEQFRRIAHAFLAQQNFEKAAEAFKRMKLFQSDDPGLLFTLGNIYVQLGRLNDAEQEFRSILRHDLNHLEALMALGNVCQQKGQFRDAILAFNKILSINAQEVTAKEKLGELYQAQGNLNEAIKYYLAAAHAYQFSEEADRAIRLFRRVVQLDQTNPTACRELANLGAELEVPGEEGAGFPDGGMGDVAAEPALPSMPSVPSHGGGSRVGTVVDEDEGGGEGHGQRPQGLVPRGASSSSGGGKSLIPRGGLMSPKGAGSGLIAKGDSGPATLKPRGGKEAAGAGAGRQVLAKQLRSSEVGAGKPTLASRRGHAAEVEAPVEAPVEREVEAPVVQEPVPEPIREPVEEPVAEVYAPPVPEPVLREQFNVPMMDPSAFEAVDLPVPPEPVRSRPAPAAPPPAAFGEEVALPPLPVEPEETVRAGGTGLPDFMRAEAPPPAVAEQGAPATAEAGQRGAGPSLLRRGFAAGRERVDAEPPPAEAAPAEGHPEAGKPGLFKRGGFAGRGRGGFGAAGRRGEPSGEGTPSRGGAGSRAPVEAPVESDETFLGPPPDISEEVAVAAVPVAEEAPPQELPVEAGSGGAPASEPAAAMDSGAAGEVRDTARMIQAWGASGGHARAPQTGAPEGEKVWESHISNLLSQPVPDEREKMQSFVDSSAPETSFEVARLEEYIGAGDMTRSILVLRKCLQEMPGDAGVRARLADVLFACGMVEDAAAEYVQLVQQNTENLPLLHRLADVYLWTSEPERAVPLLVALSYIHRQVGEVEEAFQALQDALTVQHEHSQARWELAELFGQAEQPDLALWHLRSLAEIAEERNDLEAASESYRRLFQLTGEFGWQERLAYAFEAHGRIEQAVAEYKTVAAHWRAQNVGDRLRLTWEKISDLAPEDMEAQETLLALYQASGEHDKALARMLVLSRVARERGDVERARKLFEEIVKRDAGNLAARKSLVELCLEQGLVSNARNEAQPLLETWYRDSRIEEGVALLQCFVLAQPDDVSLREQLIHFFERAEDPDRALEERINLARYHLSRSAVDEALKVFQKALSLDDRNPEVHYQLGLVYADYLENPVEAESEFTQVKKLDPTHKEAMKRLIHLQLKLNKARDAIETLSELIRLAPENRVIRDEILAEYKRRVQEAPDDHHGRFTLGVLYKENNLLDLAIEQFQETRKVKELLLQSYNMLGTCFALKKGFNTEDLAIKQFKKGLETKGYNDVEYLELYYNLAEVYNRRNELEEAKRLYTEIQMIDIKYRDVAEKLAQVQGELDGTGKGTRPRR